MTGTRSFNSAGRIALGMAMAACAHADDLVLESEARLTGTIRSIGANGAVELESTLSPEPILLKGEAVRMVTFSPPDAVVDGPTTRVELVNGDVLPATVEKLDEKVLTANSPDIGRLRIPREYLKSIQLGVRRREVVYSGPANLEEWIREGENARNWTFENQALVAKGIGRISRKVETPRQFIIRFTLKWQDSPNFRLFFSEPADAPDLQTTPDKPVDRYFVQYNAQGLELKRESSKGRRYLPVLMLNRTPDQFSNKRLKVEIRVDRNQSLIHLFLNDENEGRYKDNAAEMPDGKMISLVSLAANGSEQEVRDLEILAWDDSVERHRTEDRGDPAVDSLITRQEDRYGGSLLSIANSGGRLTYFFKSDFQENLIDPPESEVSTVFFASREGERPDATDAVHPFVLKLRGEGSLRVSSCTFSSGEVRAAHPLLGALVLRRAGVSALERAKAAPAAEP